MNFEAIFSSLGIFSLSLGQSIMLIVGLLILYLAISKKFEPLLLLPIGFGAILTNIPEIGLALSPIEKLIYFSNSEELAGALSLVVLGDAESLSAFLKQLLILSYGC
jgi:oxaloacetate decarboxylase beta subunit